MTSNRPPEGGAPAWTRFMDWVATAGGAMESREFDQMVDAFNELHSRVAAIEARIGDSTPKPD